MLPVIREDDSAKETVFEPKARYTKLQSRGKLHSDMLQKKLKQLRGPKIKKPECLLKHMMDKQVKEVQTYSQGFPCLEDMMRKIKSLSSSPIKRFAGSFEKSEKISPGKPNKFKLLSER